MTRRTRRCLAPALAMAALALPAAASANTAATLFQADFTGTMTLTNTEAGPDANWTTTASFPLNGTTKAGSGYLNTNPALSDIWIPTGSIGASQTVYPVTYPDFSGGGAPDPSSSLSSAGTDNVTPPVSWNCGPYTIVNSLDPELGVTTTGS